MGIKSAAMDARDNDRPILDRTGLTGTYDVDLWWVPERSSALVADPADVPYEVIVIDAVELPELD